MADHFYKVGDYVVLDDDQGYVVELLPLYRYKVASGIKLIEVHELDIEVRDNEKSITEEEVKELLAFTEDRIEVKATFGCGHVSTIITTIDDAGFEVSAAINELCPSCEREAEDAYMERMEQEESGCRKDCSGPCSDQTCQQQEEEDDAYMEMMEQEEADREAAYWDSVVRP